MLATPDSGRVTPLRHVHIAVAWQDGVFEESVVRDTFVFDAASVSGMLEGLQDTQRAPRGPQPGGRGRRRRRGSAVTRRHAAFTLIEMMAVMLLLGILVSSVVNFYIQLSRESNAAAAATRGSRRAVAALDRIARELESAILVIRPEGEDPLSHPWLFWAEREGRGDGADTLRFTTRGRRPRASAAYESDLAVVGYALRESPDGPESGSELMRWTSPRLPDGLERNVPRDEQDGAQVLVEGVTEFGLRFLSEGGEWKEEWDSSTVDSNLLPLAAEIRLALAEESDSALEARPRRSARWCSPCGPWISGALDCR